MPRCCSSRAARPRDLPLAAAVAAVAIAFFDCTLTSVGIAPLPDLGPGEYLPGVPGGLYPGGQNTRPPAHLAAGLAIAADEIEPRNAAGAIDLANGRIGMISIGMSNTTQEFDGGPGAFKPRADADPARNPRLEIVDGAQAGQGASDWVSPGAQSWSVLAQRLQQANVAPAQVQVAWIKQAEGGPGPTYGGYPAHVEALQDDMRAIVTILVDKYPNVRLAYLSSRTRAYTQNFSTLNPEPFAWESGLAVRGLIGEQLGGSPALAFVQPGAEAPWLSWGPYLWADGTTPRSDGFTWQCSDTVGDFTHPSTSGETKVADQLLAFFKTDPTSVPWFLRASAPGQPPQLTLAPRTGGGPAPLTVGFQASTSDPDGTVTEIAWTFDDGCFAYGAAPTKVFPAPGVYAVHVTASDDSGNTTVAGATITVTAPGGGPWSDLGLGLGGAGGTPVLTGSGTLAGGSSVALDLAGAAPNAGATLVIGLSAILAPFKGGTLVPAPDVLVPGLTTDASGALHLAGTWPAGLPSGFTTVLQEWIADPAAAQGFAASNGLSGTTP